MILVEKRIVTTLRKDISLGPKFMWPKEPEVGDVFWIHHYGYRGVLNYYVVANIYKNTITVDYANLDSCDEAFMIEVPTNVFTLNLKDGTTRKIILDPDQERIINMEGRTIVLILDYDGKPIYDCYRRNRNLSYAINYDRYKVTKKNSEYDFNVENVGRTTVKDAYELKIHEDQNVE